jgi:hypothetical protein
VFLWPPRLHLLISLPIVTSAVSPPVTTLMTIQHLAGTTKNSTLAFLLSIMRGFVARTLLTSTKPSRTRSLMEHRPQKSVFLRRRNEKSTFIKAAYNRGPMEGTLWTHPSNSRRSPAGEKQRTTRVPFLLDEISTTGLSLALFLLVMHLSPSSIVFHVFFRGLLKDGHVNIHLARIPSMDGLGQIARMY